MGSHIYPIFSAAARTGKSVMLPNDHNLNCLNPLNLCENYKVTMQTLLKARKSQAIIVAALQTTFEACERRTESREADHIFKPS
jgi:hypothetical protein